MQEVVITENGLLDFTNGMTEDQVKELLNKFSDAMNEGRFERTARGSGKIKN